MKKTFTILIAAIAAILMMAQPGKAVGQTADYTYTLANGDFTTSTHIHTSGILTWTHSHTSGTESYGWDDNYGFKFGSSNSSYPTAFKLTSSSVSNKIKKVVITASVNSKKSCKLDVKVGSTTYGSQVTINTKNNDAFEFSIADASTVNGAVELSFSSNTGPLYLKKIEIFYYNDTPTPIETSYVLMDEVDNVDLSASYGTNSTLEEGDGDDIEQGTELTLSYSNVASGYAFTSWIVTDDDENDVTDDVLEGNTLTVPDYDILISATVSVAQQYTITFNPGNGTCATASQSCSVGTTITTFPTAIPSETCAGLGWVFVGWATSSVDNANSNPTVSSYTVSGNATLYAVYAESASKEFDFAAIASANEWVDGTAYTPVTIAPVSITAEGGGNNGKWYSSNSSWRIYSGGTVRAAATNGRVVAVSSSPSCTFTIINDNTTNDGTAEYSPSARTDFTNIIVKYVLDETNYATSPSCTPKVATPTIAVAGVGTGATNTYYETASVTLNCDTEGATIYYTTNNTAPTTESSVYSVPFDVTSNSTIRAIAALENYTDSDEATPQNINIAHRTDATFTNGVYSESFSSSLGLWYANSVSGTYKWAQGTPVTNYTGAWINGYNENANNEDWLISPKMTVLNGKLAISFKTAARYSGAAMVVKYSTDYNGYGNPNSGDFHWTTLNPSLSTNENSSYNSWTDGEATISGLPNNANVYVAFVYTSSYHSGKEYTIKDFSAKQCYAVTYNANGGSGVELVDTNSPYAVGATVTVINNTYTAPAEPDDMEFSCWNTQSDGKGISYYPGTANNTFTMGYAPVELFAIWTQGCPTDPGMAATTNPSNDYINDEGDKSWTINLSSSVTSIGTGGCEISEYGFVYSIENDKPTTDDSKLSLTIPGGGVTTGAIQAALTGATESTTYYIRSYAINGHGTGYGAAITVTTSAFPKCTLTYSENGVTHDHASTIYKDDVVNLSNPTGSAPANMTFAGWAEAEISKFAEVATTITSYTATANKTVYAVYEYNCPTGNVAKGWKKVTNAATLSENDKLILANEEYGKVALGIDAGNAYLSAGDAEFTNGIITTNNENVVEFTLYGSSSAWTLKNGNKVLTTSAAKKMAWDGSGNGVASTWTIGITNGDATITSSTTSYGSIKYNSQYPRFLNYASGQQVIQLYRYEDIAATKSYYVTSVTELDAPTTIAVSTTTTLDHNVTINTYSYIINGTLNSDGYLIANKTANKIVVNNGGQLKVSNAVKATVKKDITQNWVPASGIGWYTISTPTGSTGFGDVENLKPMDDDNRLYDIYRYKESTMTWENSIEAGFDNDRFEEGRGYLYRKGNTSALEFAGPVNIATSYKQALTVTGETEIAGFALLGNPYSHNITLKHVVAEGNTLDECYVLTGENAWITKLTAENDDEIAPCQGFLVQATTAGDAYIHKTAQSSKGRANNDYIKFIVANSQYEDVTFALFDEGHGLNKINHRNSNIQKIYIPKDGESFAVATMADNTQSFNLNFKAMTMGQYTLSFKTKGEFNYLHVIDRMTGDDIDMLLEGEYSFVGSPQDDEARFIVRLGYLPNYDDNGENIFAYQNGSDVIVSGEGELQIFDVMGRMVSTQNVNGTETISVNAQGVYIFRLVGSEIKTQKIIIK